MIQNFVGKDVIITEKMDGENTTIYSDGYIHARSIDSGYHPSRTWVQNYAAGLSIPNGYRICGENMYAMHSIQYENLHNYFLAFAVWYDDLCLDWDDAVDILNKVGIHHVPIIYRGTYTNKVMHSIINSFDVDRSEGFVVRRDGSFKVDEFQYQVAKWVRPNHVQTSDHWMFQSIVKNNIKRG